MSQSFARFLINMSGDITGDSSTSTVTAISGPSPILITPSILQWLATTTTPTLKQADLTTGSGVGATLTIQSQNETGATSTGGDLTLTSGTGTTIAGHINLQTGGTTRTIIDPTGNIQFLATSTDFGTAAVGILSIGAVTTAPTAQPSTSIGIWNAAGLLTTNATGYRVSNTLATNHSLVFNALASTSGATTAGFNMTVIAQAGQAGTGGSNGATGGIGGTIGGAGGSSDTGAGGIGGVNIVNAGAGGVASAGAGNGGAGGTIVIQPGVGGTSAGGAAGADGVVRIRDHTSGSDTFVFGQQGYGGQAVTPTIATSGTTTLLVASYKFPVIRCGTITLAANVVLEFPNTNGQWWLDTSGINLNTHTFSIKSGSTTTVLTPSTTAPFFIQTFGTNVLLIK